MTDDVRARLTRLEDIETARSLLTTYGETMDSPARDAVVGLFRTDAVLDTGHRTATGHAEIGEFFRSAFARDPSPRRHFVLHPRATWQSPGRVRVVASFLFTGRGTDRSIIGWGIYDGVIDTDAGLFAGLTIDLQRNTDLTTGWSL